MYILTILIEGTCGKNYMKVGDVVKLKPSVLHSTADLHMQDRHGCNKDDEPSVMGVIVSKDLNAVKVHWFCSGSSSPPINQYVLKLKVVSEL